MGSEMCIRDRVLDADAALEPSGEGRTWPLWPAFAVLAGLLWPVDVAWQLAGKRKAMA